MSRLDRLWPLVYVAIVLATSCGIGAVIDALPRPPAPHVASDCRAECTLGGMALVGVELARSSSIGHDITCLCAPIEPSPGGCAVSGIGARSELSGDLLWHRRAYQQEKENNAALRQGIGKLKRERRDLRRALVALAEAAVTRELTGRNTGPERIAALDLLAAQRVRLPDGFAQERRSP